MATLYKKVRIRDMKNLAPEIVRQRLLIEGFYEIEIDKTIVEKFLIEFADFLSLRHYEAPTIYSPKGLGKDSNEGFDAFLPLIDSGISLYVWSTNKFFATILFSCKEFDSEAAVSFTKSFFKTQTIEHNEF